MNKQQSILITGASSGLGKALAISYASKNTHLFLTGRNQKRLTETKTLCQQNGATVTTKILDICDKVKSKKWIQDITKNYSLDIVIASAGISTNTSMALDTEDQLYNCFETNVGGVLNTVIPTIDYFTKHKKGHIVIISSLAGYVALPNCPDYTASKAAVRAFGHSLRNKLSRHNVKVTVVAPGFIDTPIVEKNHFPMPMIMSAEKAALIIKERLKKNPPTIAFPLPMYFLSWFLGSIHRRVFDIVTKLFFRT